MIKKIAQAIGVQDKPRKVRWLAECLRDLPDSVSLYRSRYAIKRPKQVANSLDRVANSITKLLLTYGADKETGYLDWTSEKDGPFEVLILWQRALALDPKQPERLVQDDHALASLQERLDSLVQLRREILQAKSGLDGRTGKGHGGRRHLGDPVQNEIFKDLLQLYTELTGTGQGITVDHYANNQDEDVRGPLIEFFILALPPLGWTSTRKAIRARLGRLSQE